MASFPANKYSRYKRCTAFFLDWLLRARGRGRHAGQRVQLQTLSDVVQELAADPSTLTPKLFQELPKALAACQCAITLREHVSSFFPQDDEGQIGHLHFLELLKKWHKTLKELVQTQQNGDEKVSDSTKFENYYEVLQMDEDYFPEEGDVVVEAGEAKTDKRDRDRLLEEAFAQDLRVELVAFFFELDELIEVVYKMFQEVKRNERTLMEATVVAKLAMDTASALTAQLQLNYPTLRTAKEMYNVVRNMSPGTFRMQFLLISTYIMNEVDGFEQEGAEVRYIPGSILVDLLCTGTTLESFASVIPIDLTSKINILTEYVGDPYGEERTPLYVLQPETNNDKVFLMQLLPRLFNDIAEKKEVTGVGYERSGPMYPFMKVLDKFFTTREVTVPVVFACICWMKSVAALQGDAGLGRSVSLTFKHSAELLNNIEATLKKGKVLMSLKKANELLGHCGHDIKQAAQLHHVVRANPVQAGLTMLNHHFQYMHIGSEALLASGKFRAFGHLYNALVQQGFLESIWFFDEMLDIYGKTIFTPSRDAAVPGEFYRTYLLSGNLKSSFVDAVCCGEDMPVSREAYKKPRAFHLSDVSDIFRLMMLNDKSVLEVGSWTDMLESAANICSDEIYESCVLSRNLLKLNDDLMDLFVEMCKLFGHQDFSKIVARPRPGESYQERVDRAIDEAVMTFLLPLLDGIRPDGSIHTNTMSGKSLAAVMAGADYVTAICTKIAGIITTQFAASAITCEKYFIYPINPDEEYGTTSFKAKTKNDNRAQVFSDLMKLLRESRGPLTGQDLEYLKEEIKKDPELLGMVTPTTTPRPENDLCTLLHLAAAGPAHDAGLVEWMVQLGALYTQPLHCRKEPRQRDLTCARKLLPNTMAVHSAVIAGHIDIAKILVEADNLVDLNTPTYHTKETLAHLAVKHENRGLLELLGIFGADLRIKDGNGRRIYEVTSDRKWSRELSASIDKHFDFSPEAIKRRLNLFHSQTPNRTELSPKSTSAQRAQDSVSTTGGKKSKKKKKNKKKDKREKLSESKAESIISAAAAASPDASAIEMSRILKHLLQSFGCDVDPFVDSEDVPLLTEQLRNMTSALFDRLNDTQIPASEKVDDVKHACKLIDSLIWYVDNMSDATRINTSHRHMRVVTATEAVPVIHLMQKFSRVGHGTSIAPELDPLLQLCHNNLAFMRFVVGTAKICVSIERKSQAREILDGLEKRLVKVPFASRDPSEFREVVDAYSSARNEMGLGKTSSIGTYRTLEWYLTDTLGDYDLQLSLDGLAGRPFYFDLRPTKDSGDHQFDELKRSLDAHFPESEGLVYFGDHEKRVLYGGISKADVARVHNILLGVAASVGIKIDNSSSRPCTNKVHVGNFTFSAAGILPMAAAS